MVFCCILSEKEGFFMKRFIDITDFTREELREAINLVTFVKDNEHVYANEMVNRTLINAFFEEDRNAQMTFTTAATRMGGSHFDFPLKEGESLKDAVMTMSACGDVIVLKHPKKGAARAASLYATIPVINAGDGDRAYPVKTLADISSVWIEKNHISNMKIGFVGDFSNNPLVRGLLQCLNIYKGNEFYFISVNGKPITEDFISIMDRREKPFVVYDNLAEPLPELDVVYFTEIKKDSFDSAIQYEARKHCFSLDERLLLTAKKDLAILHQFPRGEELDMSIDSDERAKYFKMLNYNVNSAMAIILKLITKRTGRLIKPCVEEATHDFKCMKDDCITSTEDYLPPLFHENAEGELICKYCGQKYEAK